MESYIFKTSCDTLGLFQKSGGSCSIYLGKDFFPVTESVSWDEWIDYCGEASSRPLPQSTLNDPISSAVSFFVWKYGDRVSPDIVDMKKSVLPAGDYYIRTNWNSFGLFETVRRHHSTIDEIRSYNNLTSALSDIFNVVEPDVRNREVYGHRIRELLTISCSEVEYLFLQVLKDNGYFSPRYSTNDYVKILPLLKLNEYRAELYMHPAMGTFSPFKDWNAQKPTESLSWYSSYNAAKHDRGGNFHQATLGAVINAISAVHILLEAQYGHRLFESPLYSTYESCFQTVERPTWDCCEMVSPYINESQELVWNNARKYFDDSPV